MTDKPAHLRNQARELIIRLHAYTQVHTQACTHTYTHTENGYGHQSISFIAKYNEIQIHKSK